MTRRPLLLLAAILLALLVVAFLLWCWVGLLRDLARTSVPIDAVPTPQITLNSGPDAVSTPASRDLARPVLPASPDPAADQPAARAAQGPVVVGKAAAGLSVWDKLAFCESRGQWHINTGNGYYGGLQENMDFWRSYGDPQWARPDLAPKSAQIEAAVKARDSGRGYEPWPQCSVEVGLR